MAFERSKYTAQFKEESRERLQAMARWLTACREKAGRGDALRNIIKGAHTIRGSATMLGYARIAAIARELESGLEGALSQEITMWRPLLDKIAGQLTSMEMLLEKIACEQE
ncbi:MAG: Hpt domain-containing protein [Candidatus Aureabacteria bacterium]|nr:Hpt domain-containing protein [Candidatus Auribacterota bacterium]